MMTVATTKVSSRLARRLSAVVVGSPSSPPLPLPSSSPAATTTAAESSLWSTPWRNFGVRAVSSSNHHDCSCSSSSCSSSSSSGLRAGNGVGGSSRRSRDNPPRVGGEGGSSFRFLSPTSRGCSSVSVVRSTTPSTERSGLAPPLRVLPSIEPRRSWFTSSSVGGGSGDGGGGGGRVRDGDDDEEEDRGGGGGYDSTAAWTTPLSDVSESDLNLAAMAAAEAEAESSGSESPSSSTGGAGDHLSDIPGAQKGGKKLAIVFTCNVCETRSAKKFTEQAYNHGVVMVRCPGCQNLHLVADRLGFFGEKEEGGWDVQRALAKMGDNVKAVSDDNVLELTMADVLGRERTEELQAVARSEAEATADEGGGTKDGVEAAEAEKEGKGSDSSQ